MKHLAELTDSEIDRMTKPELVDRLARLNAFGGYSTKDKPQWLRSCLKSWRDRARR